ncbi:DUF2500 domain-containing protein [Paenibacillus sediminis]|uniref:DUF2500 domain-containing protein n=1 Tax=Paenibacillus sediminis TaxID=664909 RepID=A0ABS4H0D1_9BACL|nr:DUF2500 domain-containing protein [Paenibacillus sediminis]MBP1935983.1 hypothetical protein [Paenibacillus sediminis]
MGLESIWMFDFFGNVIPFFFVVILAIIIISAGKGIYQWSNNNRQPLLTVQSVIVSKRMDVSHHHDQDHTVSRSQTRYYVTFEVESGDRMEFGISGAEFGQCAEGDEGKLTFQGTRYLGFQRTMKAYAHPEDHTGYRRGNP